MAKADPFESHHHRYDTWFVRHAPAYHAELLAVRALLPWSGLGLSVGVGTGRFAAPLGVQVGIDPARSVLPYAQERGVAVAQGVAEALPFANVCFDQALIVTTICFLDDVPRALSEVFRVLKPGGRLVIGFIDRNSDLGRHYLAHQSESLFYREAVFFSAEEVEQALAESGFSSPEWVQTLSKPLPKTRDIEPARPGRGSGAFVVVRAARP